jgi:hypothetical protein
MIQGRSKHTRRIIKLLRLKPAQRILKLGADLSMGEVFFFFFFFSSLQRRRRRKGV